MLDMELTSLEPIEGERIRFGPFCLHVSTGRLLHNATPVPLQSKQAELLVLLAKRAGRAVSRDEIMESLWGTSQPYDCALSQAVNRLRRGLEAFEATTDYVRTVRGFGYRLDLAGCSPSNGGAEPLFMDPAFRRCQLAVFKQNTQLQMVESIDYFKDALALNPVFVPALVGLARAYYRAGTRSLIDPLTAYYEAKAAIAKAIALDASSADAFTILSLLVLFFDANLAGARDAAEQAVALSPDAPKARNALAWQLVARGDHAGALMEAYRGLDATPSDPSLTAMLGIALYMSHRYDEACVFLEDSVNFSPACTQALFYYACARYLSHSYDEALAILDRIPSREMQSRVLAVRGCIAIRQGRRDERKRCEAALAALPFPSDIFIAAMRVASDDLDAAAHSLSEALKTREPALFVVTIDPLFDPLPLSHPRLVTEIRRGRQHCCDRCAVPLTYAEQPLHALRLCDTCN
jgi:DNA-binding winged helix-turn-helix (wHTH) protein/thioredoxin-like negative regulator of GroEL